MALVITDGNPIKITGSTATAQAIFTNFRLLAKILWYNVATGQILSIVNTDGDQKFKYIVPTLTTNGTIDVDLPKTPCYGMQIDDMDGGELYIYTCDPRDE